jgi:predicted nucleic acid-binding protein
LIDTCALSEAFKPRPHPKVSSWFKTVDNAWLNLSVLTLGEIQKGISKLKVSSAPRAVELSEDLHKVILRQYQDRILPLDLDVVLRWGEIAGMLEGNGIKLPIADGLIAATASVHGLVLVTRNEKDFRGTGIEIHNPWS